MRGYNRRNGKVIFPRFPLDACNLDSRCITWNSPSWSAAGMARHSRVSVVTAFCALSFLPSTSLAIQPLHLPAGVKLLRDANGRFIRSEKGESIERSVLERLQASGVAAPCPEYEISYSETNLPYFANNDANPIVAKYFRVHHSR